MYKLIFCFRFYVSTISIQNYSNFLVITVPNKYLIIKNDGNYFID